MKGAGNLLASDPVKLAIAAAIVGVVGYALIRQLAKDAGKVAGAAAGAASDVIGGNTSWNEGTVYEGAGVAGTLGGAANKAIPILDDFGSWLGGKIYELRHPEWNRTAPTAPASEDRDERDWWPFW